MSHSLFVPYCLAASINDVLMRVPRGVPLVYRCHGARNSALPAPFLLLQARAAQGFQFLAILSDSGLLAAEAARVVEALELRGSHPPTSAAGTPAAVGGSSVY